jgi:predicted alpha/beta-hydrolase family hydrolase
MYGSFAVRRRGGYVHKVTWSWPPAVAGAPRQPQDALFRESAPWVGRQAAAGLDEMAAATGAADLLVMAKSFGTLAAPLVAERCLPAVWFTPLLTEAPTVAALRRAAAPSLLVGGTADPFWDGAIARSITPHVVEIEGADHQLFVPGPLAASATVLGTVATAVERFLDGVVWS